MQNGAWRMLALGIDEPLNAFCFIKAMCAPVPHTILLQDHSPVLQ